MTLPISLRDKLLAKCRSTHLLSLVCLAAFSAAVADEPASGGNAALTNANPTAFITIAEVGR